ncbi:NACHT domain-containing protein [Spirosoma endophyticum]|nr:ATP-binding protein [Spirosoma endophyticum]
MKIKRQELLQELYKFALEGSGMVVGIPGIGKSYLLRQLLRKLVSNDVLCFIIKIDTAYDSSDEAIASELRIEGNWIEVLGNIQLKNEHKAVLVFDAFDAARDEEKRAGFLKQIKKAKALLNNKWNILVSVRTYDATKSTDLTHLFSPPTDLGSYAAVRKFKIGELNESEIQEASTENPNLFNFYLESTLELKEILHVPFFLKILETILSDYVSDNLEEIKHYKSETQLLDFFWQKKIDETNEALSKQQFLLWFTKQLITNKILSLSKLELIQIANKNQLDIFDYLRSENILDEISLRNSRVAYTHNIFFDYAVNRLCLDHDYVSLLSFIAEDYSRAFFLRPSFVYFFTSVWYEDQQVFWELYTKLAENKQKEIQLFVRLVINGTIASQFSSTNELYKILELNGTDKGNESIRNVLQSIRFIRNRTIAQDVSLLNVLSKELQLQYLFEFSFLLERAINDVKDDLLVVCGDSARNLLSYVLNNRNSETKHFLDRIGSMRGIELIAKTFRTNPKQSSAVLQRIFPLLDEPGFEIGYFTNLSEEIKHFVDFDPALVSEVYKVIFGHRETSSEKTQMGPSVVMNFTSNRSQDFDMCYFRLEQFFPTFIASSPEIAAITGIEIVNETIFENQVHSDYKQGFTFDYQGVSCTFYPDYSAIWSDRHLTGQAENLGKPITSYIGKLFGEDNTQQAAALIRTYISNAKVGYLWKLLMQLANEYPEPMFELVLPLVLVPEFLSSSDTSYEVRGFIEKVDSLLANEQIEAIEDAIFNVYQDGHEYGIHAILSAINPERLQTTRAREFMVGREIKENVRPYQFSSSITPYSTEEWLRDQGVDVTDAHIAELTRSVNYLDNFNHQYLNATPRYQEYKPYLKAVFALWEEITTNKELPEDLEFTILNTVARTAAISSRDLTELPVEDFNQLKHIITYSFNHVSKYDLTQKDNSAVNGYSSTPRIESSEALPLLYVRDNDPEILALYRVAIADASSVVRYNSIKNLPKLFNKHFDVYRTLLFERLQAEKDAFNFAILLSVIYFKEGKITDDGNAIIQIANRKTHLFQQQKQFVDSYAELLLWFLNEPDMPTAFETLVDGYQYSSFSNTVIFRSFKQIQTYEPRSVFQENLSWVNVILKVIDNYIDQAGHILTQTKDFKVLNPGVENALDIFDGIVMRIYFALEANPRVPDNYNHYLPANEENREELYFLIKPLIKKILNFSSQITDKGLLIGRTAHYMMQTLNSVVSYDSRDILSMVADITRYSIQTGYSFDSFSIREIVSLTEKLLADHRELLLQEEPFQDLLSILEIHINSGWVDALELLWKLDEVFK